MVAVLMGTFNLGAGAPVPFKVALAIVIYGSLPGIFRALLGTIALFVESMAGSLDKEASNITNPVNTNFASLMDLAGSKFTYSMSTAVDLFVGFGFACNSTVKPWNSHRHRGRLVPVSQARGRWSCRFLW